MSLKKDLKIVLNIIDQVWLTTEDIDNIKNILTSIIAKSDKKNVLKKEFFKPKEIKEVGRYWGLRFGEWQRVVVKRLSTNNDTGRMSFIGSSNTNALSNCELYYGKILTWKDSKPKISKKRLLKLGVSEFWLR